MKQVIAFIILCMFSTSIYAQNFDADFNPEMVIKYRVDFMTAVKGHNNGIKAVVNGAVPFPDHLSMHVDALEKLFERIPELFPEGSDFGETHAKDAIWDNPEKFSDTVTKAQQALSDFKKVVAAGDMAQTRSAFKEFGKNSCGSCHRAFKRKHDH
ncbi:hypothetical protein BOV90_01110 [Solemya velum gill symbiont]|uniref:Cytochrome C n=2 Tax=Solemya velum gill symbiont TaxID=2340 RepID=A0A1T2CLK5_SOVGS|nr:cytochrome c [Solemya velum gill symbiont]OOY35716.1 hypothetical protein BOV88_03490 [Solemya velum gill symbiont]OOY38344.1 hypothetical protein BOV89_02755 [Solemya velum gill symbiont]OOY40943.1 hypothetical protein BOV90_01110 [Solemya velum gill symbiont]OOY41771.1 hypothetical protein BOV91_09710 [Solemya velum gill symbiont]OOY46257.1 hypothetical protein BOV92_03465 [Solemya velum gill symbiont]